MKNNILITNSPCESNISFEHERVSCHTKMRNDEKIERLSVLRLLLPPWFRDKAFFSCIITKHFFVTYLHKTNCQTSPKNIFRHPCFAGVNEFMFITDVFSKLSCYKSNIRQYQTLLPCNVTINYITNFSESSQSSNIN